VLPQRSFFGRGRVVLLCVRVDERLLELAIRQNMTFLYQMHVAKQNLK
jgi:hypothetical protein